MLNFKKTNINGMVYLVKEFDGDKKLIAVLNNGKFKTSVNIPRDVVPEELELLKNSDIEHFGYTVTKKSALKMMNTTININTSFVTDGPCYIQDIDVLNNLLPELSSKNKGVLVFENNGQFSKILESKQIDFKLYNKANLKINYGDLNERILLDALNLSNKEQSVIASFLNYKQQNESNKEFGVPVLDGSNWVYDIHTMDASYLAQQFKVNEYSIKSLKTNILKLSMNGVMSLEFSSIKEILDRLTNGEIVVIDVPDTEKKLTKAVLSHKSNNPISIVDNVYNKYEKLHYVLYECNLFPGTANDFSSMILNKRSSYLKNDIVELSQFQDELILLDYEYIVIRKKSYPIFVTTDDFSGKSKVKQTKVQLSSISGFY